MSAVISKCGLYRLALARACEPTGPRRLRGYVLWVMLNPSTADANLDDPTIRRIKDFTGRWGYSRAVVVNLYSFRATDPKVMLQADDPVGPENDASIVMMAASASKVVCGWGKHGEPLRVAAVVDLLSVHRGHIYCLGTNEDGSPKHPLYLKKTTPLQPWKLPA